MTPHQALQTVTINSARVAHADKDLGTVETGKLADLVAVRGNPLEDLKAAANAEIVIKNGNVYRQEQILAPFRTPLALAARSKAIRAYQKLCEADPDHCGPSIHAH